MAETLISHRKKEPIKRLKQLEDVLSTEGYSALRTSDVGPQSSRYRIAADAVVNDGRRRLLAEVNKQGNQLLFFKVN